jgi:hypothetical protein
MRGEGSSTAPPFTCEFIFIFVFCADLLLVLYYKLFDDFREIWKQYLKKFDEFDFARLEVI